MFIKKSFIKFENLYPQPDYNKKDKNNKNNRVLFTRFIVSINSFIYIILNRFVWVWNRIK
jgi:hypothetical protein